MQLYRITALFIGLILALLSDPLWSKEQKYLSNIDHSSIFFKVKFLEISDVHGTFDKFHTEFQFDSQTKVISDIKISISSQSINTGNKKRDLHLKRKDFFDVKKYPEIFFESKERVSLKNNNIIQGILYVLGRKLPLQIHLKFLGQKKDTWQKENYFFEFEGFVDRRKIGLKWNKTLDSGGFVLGNEVKISGKIQAQLQGQKTVFSRFLIPDSEIIRKREKSQRGEIRIAPEKFALKKTNNETQINSLSNLSIKEKSSKNIEKKISKKFKKGDLSNLQIIGSIVVGFYGLIGAIALALLFQFRRKEEKKEGHRVKNFFRESLLDSLSIIIIFPYAIAMWTCLYF